MKWGSPFLDLSEVDIDGLDLGQQFLIIYIDDLQLLAGFHHGDVAVLEIDDLVGKLDDGLASDPRKNSPSPMPTTSGLCLRAAMMVSGWRLSSRAMA